VSLSPNDDIPDSALSLGLDIPSTFQVSVIMESRPAQSQWVERYWQAIGVTVGEAPAGKPELIFDGGGIQRYRHTGFIVELFKDECERYYHNLMAPRPRCFVIATKTDDAPPRPYKVTLDFDEAHAYEEGDENVYPVDISPELYRWCEAYVLEHFVQEKKYKRKLKDWSAQEGDGGPG